MIALSSTETARVLAVAEMARRLGEHRPEDRATPAAAIVLLQDLGFRAREILAGVDAALALLAVGPRAGAVA